MATSINVRLSNELEINLKNVLEEVKRDTPLGAEANNSTIVRGALEDFFRKIDNEKKGMKTVSYNLSKLESKKEALKVSEIIGKMVESLGETSGYGKEELIIWEVLNSLQNSVLDKAIELSNK